ncbi:AfsR/SARP family transcriptional regulator [Streptomyces sp. NBC_01497]|uniref:AfsR/SARP family transcriptional regulator n=1 Tax=Streptomyces sp. NBC_01497 TaxID=2903885 RepID=UPI002E335B40|nr:BTAD domain-containing putative transcriptional regulator [Streptomyces sp. NBC_01497]
MPPSAIGSLRTYIYRLRQGLGGEDGAAIKLTSAGYSLEVEPGSLDLDRFKTLTTAGRAARTAGNHTEAGERYAAALALWKGAALAGVPGPYARAQRTKLSELRLASLEEKLAGDVERGQHVEAAAELSALVEEYPLRERFCELFMTALYLAGRQAEALTAFHVVSHTLREELGVSPSPSLRRVHELILTERLGQERPNQNDTATQSPISTFVTPTQLPAALPHFVGRQAQLDRVESLLSAERTTPGPLTMCVIGGLAGVGKTAFAVQLAHRLASRFPHGVLFSDLGSFGPTVESQASDGPGRAASDVLEEFLTALGTAPRNIPPSRRARSALFRGLTSERKMLIVLDNVHGSHQVRELLPGAGGCAVIVTSRNRLPGLLATHQAVPLTLGPFTRDEGRELLTHQLGYARTTDDPAATNAIVRLCGGLPLALSIVAARAVYHPAHALSGIAQSIGTHPSRLDALKNEDEPGLDTREALFQSYSILDSASARLFRLLGLHAGLRFTDDCAARLSGIPLSRARSLLGRLSHGSLIEENDDGLYSCHKLVLAYAAELAKEHETMEPQHIHCLCVERRIRTTQSKPPCLPKPTSSHLCTKS